ncbi:MAG: cupin domain-containing protein [Alphaproteobacteria bacterium]
MSAAPVPAPKPWSAAAIAAAALLALAATMSFALKPAHHHHPHAPVLQSEASGANPARPRTIVRPVASSAVPTLPGQHMSLAVVEFPPGGYSPPHVHGGSVYVYVLSGAIRSQLEGSPPGYFKHGDTFFEPQGVVHLVAENLSATEPATILAVFIHETGAVLTTYLE